MLTAAENERLTRYGIETPMGELLRRYWHPIAGSAEFAGAAVRPVRILGEDLVLFWDRQGTLGLVVDRCPHRGAQMRYGIPENEGLRCPYHGRVFNCEGTCLETPSDRGRRWRAMEWPNSCLSRRGTRWPGLRLSRAGAGAALAEVGISRPSGFHQADRIHARPLQLVTGRRERARSRASLLASCSLRQLGSRQQRRFR